MYTLLATHMTSNKDNLLGPVQKAQGDVYDVLAPRQKVTVPFPLRIAQVMGPYTERDRKLYVLLLHAAHHNLQLTRTHTISASEVEGLYEKLGGGKDRGWIWESASNLAQTTIYWLTQDTDGKTVRHITPLLSYASKKDDDDTLVFEFPERLIPVLISPYRFSRLRTHFLLGLSGKYTITLYEIFEAFTRDGILEVSIADLRKWIGAQDSLKEFKAFRRRALEPALKQINDNSQQAGFTVQMEPIQRGKRIVALKFILTKTSQRIREEEQWSKPEPTSRGMELSFRGEVYEKAKKVCPGWDVYALEQQFNEWSAKKSEQPKNLELAFIAFCKKKALKSATSSI